MSLGPYKIERKLSSGGFGRVFQGVLRQKGKNQLIAVKLINCTFETKQQVQSEIELAQRLQQKESFPRFFEAIRVEGAENSETFALMLELLGPNLTELLRHATSLEKSFWIEKKSLFIQTLRCLSDLQLLGIVHNDVKLANFCVGLSEGRKKFIKMVDFGLACHITVSTPGFRGTLPYISPFIHALCTPHYLDDMISLFYSWVSCFISLPWNLAKDAQEVYVCKKKMGFMNLGKESGQIFLMEVGKFLEKTCENEDCRRKHFSYKEVLKIIKNNL